MYKIDGCNNKHDRLVRIISTDQCDGMLKVVVSEQLFFTKSINVERPLRWQEWRWRNIVWHRPFDKAKTKWIFLFGNVCVCVVFMLNVLDLGWTTIAWFDHWRSRVRSITIGIRCSWSIFVVFFPITFVLKIFYSSKRIKKRIEIPVEQNTIWYLLFW